MPLRRGAVYQLVDSEPGLSGVLIVTNDVWNDRMGSVVAIPVARHETEPLTVRLGPMFARAGRPVVFEDDQCASPIYTCTPSEMDEVARALAELFGLDEICRGQRPRLPPGEMRYPSWGEVYYAGNPVVETNERKRYVVVSNDSWNGRGTVASGVRLTSQRKTPGVEFPKVRTGHACCGDVTTFSSGLIQMNPRQRPQPSRLTTPEMREVAWGLVGALDLHAVAPAAEST